jgi:DNA-binding NarL/FixJ family response regulator
MVASNSNPLRTVRQVPDWHSWVVRCGLPGLERSLACSLEALGVRPDAAVRRLLLVDLPCGFALQVLEHTATQAPVVVLTDNPCPEYGEDLWAFLPAGLIVGIEFDRAFLDALARVARGERYRRPPGPGSVLTPMERAMLRVVARGWDNARIAQQFRVEDKTVRNTLTRVYTKLGVANRVEATLYYWGRLGLCT